MKNIVIKYGLIAGAILITMIITMMMVMGSSADFEKGESFGYIFIIGSFMTVFLGIREYRDKISGGLINFNSVFRVGILITLMASVIYAAGWMIYFHFFDNSFIEKYTEYYTHKIQSSGKTTEEIAADIASFKSMMENYENPLMMALYTFLEVFPIGLIITILCSLLMRRKVVVKNPS